MRKLSTFALGAALMLAAAPAFAQSKDTGSGGSPGTGTPLPNNATNTGPSTTNSEKQAPPASATPGAPDQSSGSRALYPGQNPESTPRAQSPGGGPQLPGMKGGQN